MNVTAEHVRFYAAARLRRDSSYRALCARVDHCGAPSVHFLIPRDPRGPRLPNGHLAGNLGRMARARARREGITLHNALAYFADASGPAGQDKYRAIARRWRRKLERG